MRFLNAGFFPKYVRARSEWLDDPRVRHVRSVSACVSPGPREWMGEWRHNDLEFYDTPGLAREIAEDDGAEIHGYRVWDGAFDHGGEVPAGLPEVPAVDIPAGWVRLGYDAVSRQRDYFECSPITCNNRAKDFEVNEHGLLTTVEAARAAARTFSGGGAERGRYFVFEVWAAG